MLRVSNAGFDQQQIHAAVEQPGGLRVVAVAQLVHGDVAAERNRFRSRTHGSGDETGLRGGRELVRRFAGDLRRQHVQFVSIGGAAELGEHDRRALKAVGFDNIGAGFEIGAMNGFDPLGMRAVQNFAAIFEAEKIVERRIVSLQHGPHRAVDDKNARGKGVVQLLLAKILHEGGGDSCLLLYLAQSPHFSEAGAEDFGELGFDFGRD